MGSPLGPTIANQFKPAYYKRYVDDMFLLFESRDHVNKFQKKFNSRHKCMKFSLKVENDNQLPLLDVNVSRKEGKFVTSIYRKRTYSGVYLNYKSFVPTDFKHGLIFTLLFRAHALSSNYELFHEEIVRLKTIWQKNGYPLFFIDKVIYRFLDSLFRPKCNNETIAEKKKVCITLPYLGPLSLQLKRRLRNVFKRCIPTVNLRVVFSSNNRIRNFCSFKDVIPLNVQSLIVYNFTCSTCFSTYIGKTKRHFLIRAYEHLGISYRTNKNLKYAHNTATSVRKHLCSCNHSACLDDFTVISRAKNDFHTKIKESILIKYRQPDLNDTEDSFPLYLFDD